MKKQRQQFADTIHDIGQDDQELVVMVGDISHGILQDFAKVCPGRYYNIGICEPTIVNMAAGLSKVGLTPVIHTIAPFLTERSYEQIKLDFGYQGLPVNIVTVGGSFDYSQLGCSHHCYTDVSLFLHLKDSCVFMPGSPEEFDTLFRQNYRNGKINYFRLAEYNHGVQIAAGAIQTGKGVRVMEGGDVTIVALGPQLKNATSAADKLKSEAGIAADVLYLPTVKPFDANLIKESAAKTRKVVTLEELSGHGGLYHLCLAACRDIDRVNFYQLAVHDFLHEYGTYEELCHSAGLTEGKVIKAVLNMHNEA